LIAGRRHLSHKTIAITTCLARPQTTHQMSRETDDGRSSDWTGNHVRFSEEESLSPVLLSGGGQEPFPPHPSWEVIWSSEHKNYYFWHPGSRVSRWAIVADFAPILTEKTVKDCGVIATASPISEDSLYYHRKI
jgi:hypothetical protein